MPILIVISTSNWSTAPKHLILPEPGTVHIWKIGAHSNTNASCLSAQENLSCHKLSPENALNYRRNRAGLREILSRYMHQTAAEISFSYNTSGKPYLNKTNGPIEFNLSHCNGMTVVAISQQYGVGIDVEPKQTRHNIERIAQRMFCANIFKQIQQLNGTEQNKCFVTHWTQFEARVKARGGSIFDQKNDLLPTLSIELDNKWICSLAFNKSKQQPRISQCYQLCV